MEIRCEPIACGSYPGDLSTFQRDGACFDLCPVYACTCFPLDSSTCIVVLFDRGSGHKNTNTSVQGNLDNEPDREACCHVRVEKSVALGRLRCSASKQKVAASRSCPDTHAGR